MEPSRTGRERWPIGLVGVSDKSRVLAVVDDSPASTPRPKEIETKSAVPPKDVTCAQSDAPEFGFAEIAKAGPGQHRDHLHLGSELGEERADIGFRASDVSREVGTACNPRSGRRAEAQQDLAETQHRAGALEVHPQRFPSATVCLDRKRSTVARAP